MTTTQNDNRFPIAIIAAVIVILVWMLTGCRTVSREVIKTEYVKDSTSIKQVDSLQIILHDTEMELATERSESKEADVIFDTLPCPDKPNTVEVRPDGSMVFTGNIKKANTSSQFANSESLRWKESYDSLLHVKTKDSVGVVAGYKNFNSATTKKKTGLWRFLIPLAFALGALSEYKFKWISKIVRFTKLQIFKV